MNDPLNVVDPLGAAGYAEVAYCVFNPWDDTSLYFSGGFGCYWDPSNPCPPGFLPVYRDPAGSIGYEIMQAADYLLGPYWEEGLLSYKLGSGGINVYFSTDYLNSLIGLPGGDPIMIALSRFDEVEALAGAISTYLGFFTEQSQSEEGFYERIGRFLCKDDPQSRILASIVMGGIIGAIRGGYSGTALGVGTGAILGAVIGGMVGAEMGPINGGMVAAICEVLGQYPSPPQSNSP